MGRIETYRRRFALQAALLAVLGLNLVPNTVRAQSLTDASKNTWRFAIAPHYWASSLQGSTDLGQPPAPTHAGNYIFGIGTGHLEPAFEVSATVGKARWDVDINLAMATVSDSSMIQLANVPEDSISGFYDFEWRESTARFNYRVGPYLSPYVRVYAGVRLISWSTELTNDASASLGSWDETWIDPVVGANTRFGLGAGFSGVAHVDAAGFGIGSKLSWTISGGLSYHVSGPLHLNGRYVFKEVSYDNEKAGDDLFRWEDGVAQGWFLGATLAFPGAPKK